MTDVRYDAELYYLLNPDRETGLDTDALLKRGLKALLKDNLLGKLFKLEARSLDISITATVTITFPGKWLLAQAKDDMALREILAINQQQRVLSAWHAAIAHLKTTQPKDAESPWTELGFWPSSGAPSPDNESLTERLEITSYYMDAKNHRALELALHELLVVPQLQLCEVIGLAFSVSGQIEWATIKGRPIFDEIVLPTPVPGWLKLDKKAEVVAFFAEPKVAEIIANTCHGFKVSFDQALKKAEPKKRWNILGEPIRIDEPSDVLPLVAGHDFFGVYPSIARVDESIGRGLYDLDVSAGLVDAVGGQRSS